MSDAPELTYASGPVADKQKLFAETEDFMESCLLGSMGCVSGDTRILDAGLGEHIPIEKLYEMRRAPEVVAFDNGEFVRRQASVPFIKGRTHLWRVTLADGRSMKVTMDHKFLTPSGWRTLRAVLREPGEPLLVSSEVHLPSSLEPGRSALQPNAPRLRSIAPDSQFDYLAHRRFYDEQLLRVLDNGQGVPPSLDDAPQRDSRQCDGDDLGRKCTCNPSGTSASLPSTDGSSGRTHPRPSERAQFRYAETTLSRRQAGGEALVSQSFLDSPIPPRSFGSIPHGIHRTQNDSAWNNLQSDYTVGYIKSVEYEGIHIYYDLHVPGPNNYLAEGFINHNSGKTNALCMSILFDCINYPGARIALMRSESVLLKKSTLETLFGVLAKAGLKAGKEGGNGDFYHFKNDQEIHLYLGDKVSKIYYFGLNTGDFREKLKSFEPFRAYLDEASEVDEDKAVFALIRCRQDVLHRFSYRERIEQDLNDGVIESYEDGLVKYRISEDVIDEHQLGRNLIKYVANDEGNNWIWQRCVNNHGDKPHPDSSTMNPKDFIKWVHENVGVTEVYITPDQSPRFRAGNIVELADGRTAEVEKVQPDGQLVVHVGDGRVEPASPSTTTLVLERLCVYAFSLENHSLSEDNVEAFFFADEKTRNQYLYGLVDTHTGKMFPEFSVPTHVIPSEPIPEHWLVWVGIDYNIDLACASFIAENPMGDLVIFDEFEGRSGSAEINAQEIIGKINHPWSRVKVFYDSSMNSRDPLNPADSVADTYKRAGLRDMRTANKDRDYGAQTLKDLLTVRREPGLPPRPKLFVMDNCRTTIYGNEQNHGFLTMTWDDFRLKKFDHLCLAGDTEVETVEGAKPISSIRIGERVLTRDGYKRVLDSGVTDNAAQVYKVELDNGRTLTGTVDHPVWTEDQGWIGLGMLSRGSVVTCVRNFKNTEASPSTDTRTASGIQTRGISVPRPRLAGSASATFIGSCSKTISGIFQRVATFTTRTGISGITFRRIFNASPLKNIWSFTPRITQNDPQRTRRKHTRGCFATWDASKKWLRNGMPVRKADSGILSIGMIRWLKRSWSVLTNAISAGANSLRECLIPAVSAFAQTSASLSGDATMDWMMLKNNAFSAGSPSGLTNTKSESFAPARVANVRNLKTTIPVYNLTVEGTHEFFANGVLVHNCGDSTRYAVASRGLRRPGERKIKPQSHARQWIR